MTRDEIIEAAWKSGVWIPAGQGHAREQEIDRLERFAALVATAECEKCAAIMDAIAHQCRVEDSDCEPFVYAAAAIRARGES